MGRLHSKWVGNLQRYFQGSTAILDIDGDNDCVNIKSLKLNGTTVMVARGTHTFSTASDTVVTGLNTVVACVASLKGNPLISHNAVSASVGDQAGAPAAGSIYLKAWAPTATNDATPKAGFSTFVAVDWVAIGT